MTTLYEEVRAVIRGSDFTPRKSRGQNFLVHERVIDAIVRMLDLKESDAVVEVGPGLGFLTRRLLDHAGQVWAIEVDAFLAERLRRSRLAADAKFHLVEDDFLTFAAANFLPTAAVKLAGNLPYSIATAVLFRIFELRAHFSVLVLMLQKEVADRVTARPGTKDYGALSVWCQLQGQVTDKLSVSPEAFFPRPKVRSTVLKIELFSQPLIAQRDLPSMRDLVRAAFGQRRKTLGNSLGSFCQRPRAEIEALLRSQGIDPIRRGESLSLEEFIRIAGAMKARLGSPCAH